MTRSSSPAPLVGSPPTPTRTGKQQHQAVGTSWKTRNLEGKSFQHVLSVGSGMGAFLRPCAVIGASREVSWPSRPPTLMLEGLCSHVGNWVREMIQLKAMPSSKKKAGFNQAGSQGCTNVLVKEGLG